MRILTQLFIFAFWSFLRPFLPLGLSGQRDIVVASSLWVCSILRDVRPSVNFYLVLTIILSQIWAGITKSAPNIHPGILLAGIENGGHWPWPSSLFWAFWLRILGNSTCLHNNSRQIWARIIKFTPNMHPGILLAGIENGGHWLWTSRSFWPFWQFWEIWLVRLITCIWIWARITKLYQICILGFS